MVTAHEKNASRASVRSRRSSGKMNARHAKSNHAGSARRNV
jgi:hypothetical protein